MMETTPPKDSLPDRSFSSEESPPPTEARASRPICDGTGPLEPRMSAGLTELHLPTFRAMYEEMARRATAEGWNYGGYLVALVAAECEIRRFQRIHRRLKESRLPSGKSLSTFDRNRLPFNVTAGEKMIKTPE
jgi:hypothetical protein